MSELIEDRFPDLAQVIDIGGERYFMGSQKPIELGFKSRQDYINSFGTDPTTEYLLRKYMFLSLSDKKKLQFENPAEKANLIKILKKRAEQLKGSKEFTSSTLKNTLIQRSYLNLERLIQELEGPDYKGFQLPSLPSLPDISLPCTKAKKYIRQIPEERLLQLVLEIAWYLLHPDEVPKKIECEWAKAIKELDTYRIGDLFQKIKDAEKMKGVNSEQKPFNYFKKINLDGITKAPSIKNVLDQAKEMALQIEGENSSEIMKNRLKTLLDILVVKKYLNNDVLLDPEQMKIIDVPETANSIKRSMITNPMKGGGKTLDKPLGVAMRPFFDYFKMVFDPVYSLLETGLLAYSGREKDIKKVIIPQLTTLLHICNNLTPSETTEGGAHTYGVYRITNVSKEMIVFMNTMLGATLTYIGGLQGDREKYTFNNKIFSMPKVRLSSLINKSYTGYKDPETIPYIQFLSVNGNLKKPTEDKKSDLTAPVYDSISEFFNPNDLYILCTKSDNISENIPVRLHQIDYDTIDVAETGIKIDNLPNNFFNKQENKDAGYYLEKLVNLTPYMVFNDAELAMSIFIAFKELMPK
jgi:hypothetical protein